MLFCWRIESLKLRISPQRHRGTEKCDISHPACRAQFPAEHADRQNHFFLFVSVVQPLFFKMTAATPTMEQAHKLPMEIRLRIGRKTTLQHEGLKGKHEGTRRNSSSGVAKTGSLLPSFVSFVKTFVRLRVESVFHLLMERPRLTQ
jgi:hypothetical protein